MLHAYLHNNFFVVYLGQSSAAKTVFPTEWNTLVLSKYYKHQLTYANKDSHFYNCRNVIMLMLLSVLGPLLYLLDSSVLNSLQSLDQSTLVRYQLCTVELPTKYKVYLFSTMPTSYLEELTNSLV